MAKEISAVIISKNEVDHIEACIQSLQPITDDIIVMDSGSNDGTIALAQSMGAKVYETTWQGYGPTKNHGHAHAKYDWIISIDADEVLSQNLIEEIQALHLTHQTVFAFDRQNFIQQKKIKYSGWSPDWVHRIFNKQEVQWNDNLVHEKLIIPDHFKIQRLRSKLNHYSYSSMEDYASKIEKYASLKAQSWLNNDKSPSLIKRYFGPFFKGFKAYILKGGILDGREGWLIAKMNKDLVRKQIQYFDKLKKSGH